MIRSMTAFARQQGHGEHGELTWEVRSVNHRYLEATVRLPEDLRAIEPQVRERVTARLGRGKVECNLRFKAVSSAGSELQINTRLVDQVLAAADQMAHRLHSSHNPSVMDILRWPGVMETAEQDFTPVQGAALALFDEALDTLVATREREGERLRGLITQRVDAMRGQVDVARERMPAVIDAVRERLRARLQEVAENLDSDRVEQEMALLAQRLDIDEEMDRLRTHLDEVTRVLDQNEPVGRRLDFLMQELNREANTLGSKSADSETTAVSVEMKVLIEQMREQVQNIE
ncbi:MAG: YicC/YloC family endoribonuclease [Gammaproteobacteria bacterium]|nr:YicC/YloC family endoribonuclease [Gammaproteobacteria bacterium]